MLSGSYIANRVSDKLTMVHDNIYCCRSGSASDTQAVSDYVRHFLASHSVELGRPPLTKTAAEMFKSMCYNNKNNLMAGIIVAGYDAVDGGTVWGMYVV
jgi:20S proteasome subunit beta 1